MIEEIDADGSGDIDFNGKVQRERQEVSALAQITFPFRVCGGYEP